MEKPEVYRMLLYKMNAFIANQKHYLTQDTSVQVPLRHELIQLAFDYHYSNNKFYRDICDRERIVPEDIYAKGVEYIPTIPIKLFKDHNSHLLLTKKLSEIEFELKSTGTSGIPSVSRRCRDTVDSICLGFASMYREYFEIMTGAGLFLCPSPAEVPEMGMVKAFNIFSGMFDDRIYLVERYSFKSSDALTILKNWENRFDRYILGPPFMIHRLLKYMENNNIVMPLDKKSKIIMLGGWKRFTGEQISQESLAQMAQAYLGVPRENIRDMYGLAECNFLAVECSHGHKHLPLWVQFRINDVNDGSIIRQHGKSGVISIFDPTSLAYPCFIQTEDVGRIDFEERCQCGRTSAVMAFQRRVTGAELGCCAINMEKYMESEELVKSCQLL